MRILLVLVAIKASSVDLPCKPGFDYSPDLNRCYKFVDEYASFLVAEQNCINSGGYLVSIKNDTENSFITDLVQQSSKLKYSSFWIGAADVDSSDWYWTDGFDSAYTNWISGQIDSKRGAVISSDEGLWKKRERKDKFGYICNFEPINHFQECSTCAATLNRMFSVAVMDLSDEYFCRFGNVYNVESNRCYKFVIDRVSYSDAEKACGKEGGHLASILDEDENTFISDTAQTNETLKNSLFWIGAKEKSSIWSWTDGSTFSYTNWDLNQNELFKCGAVRSDKRSWTKTVCTQKKPYVCATGSLIPACTVCHNSFNLCDSGWAYFEESNSCYKGFFYANWTYAHDSCRANGAHLASIHSKEENNFIFDLVTMAATTPTAATAMTWIGFHRKNSSDPYSWSWTDGSSGNFTYWAPGQPNDAGGDEDCVELTTDSRRYVFNGTKYDYSTFWNDCSCAGDRGHHRRYVCKKPANNR